MDLDAVDACSVRKHTLERRLEYPVDQLLPQERGARALAGANSTYQALRIRLMELETERVVAGWLLRLRNGRPLMPIPPAQEL